MEQNTYAPVAPSPAALPPSSTPSDASRKDQPMSSSSPSSAQRRPPRAADKSRRLRRPRLPPLLLPVVHTTRRLGQRLGLRHAVALLVLFLCAVLPCALFFRLYRHTFSAKVLGCGFSFGTPQNATVSGVEALFTLDATGGHFSFSQAKLLDVAWDLIVGRGAQVAASAISYLVFADALLRLVERHPAPYNTFRHVALNGAAAGSMFALVRDVFRASSKRTVALFVYLLLSIGYVLSLPTVLSAMTGYSSTSIAWVDLGGNNEQIVLAEDLVPGYQFTGWLNKTIDEPCFANVNEVDDVEEAAYTRSEECACLLPNGTMIDHLGAMFDYAENGDPEAEFGNCDYRYSNNTQTYVVSTDPPDKPPRHCADDVNITLSGQSYPFYQLNYSYTYCYGNQSMDWDTLETRSRCLPDTAHPSYQWGFATMLVGVFFVVHLVWSLALYAVWVDAQLHSRLVRSGVALSQLRASFALTAAATAQTGLCDYELVRADATALDRQLFRAPGGHGGVGTEVFDGAAALEGLRKRVSGESEWTAYEGKRLSEDSRRSGDVG